MTRQQHSASNGKVGHHQMPNSAAEQRMPSRAQGLQVLLPLALGASAQSRPQHVVSGLCHTLLRKGGDGPHHYGVEILAGATLRKAHAASQPSPLSHTYNLNVKPTQSRSMPSFQAASRHQHQNCETSIITQFICCSLTCAQKTQLTSAVTHKRPTLVRGHCVVTTAK